jgi:hypothetical protein
MPMSDDLSPVLALPLLQAAQAQKHVTHNEALRLLDVLVQPAVASRTTASPPGTPAPGTRHIVPVGATGAWAGQDHSIAVAEAGGWAHLVPQTGWQAWIADEGAEARFDGMAWTTPGERAARVAQLGIGTDPDATNRLAVVAPASLFTHAGAGHQLKLNKATAADTASLMFQTGWSGRAELGTAGSDGLALKVSPDGSTWHTVLSVAAAGGPVQLGQGLAVTGPVTGTAVMQSATDSTHGRLMALLGNTGAFGLGGTFGPQLADLDATVIAAGLYSFNTGSGTTGTNPGFAAGAVLVLQGIGTGTNAPMMIAVERSASAGRMAWRSSQGGTWSPWRSVLGRHDILGTVAQSAGQPTGAILETGTNANGRFTRHADGRQICEHTLTATGGATTADGALFRSATVPWTFPAAFATGSSPAIYGDVPTVGMFVQCAARGPASVSGLRVYSTVSNGANIAFNIRAEGRWFA